jgi:hypothetical protein
MYPQVFVRGYFRYNAKEDRPASSFFHTPHEGGPAYSEQFGKEPRAAQDGDYMMIYRHSLVCRNTEANKWEHFQMAFKLRSRPKPEVLLVKPYAMWPLGQYFFDNIKLRRVTEAEYEEVSRRKHSIKGFEVTGDEVEGILKGHKSPTPGPAGGSK